CLFLFFFFQAEDGIRDLIVTGVQTCALPISLRRFGEAQLVVDESWALARGDYALLVGIGAFLWVCWVVGTAVGLALGSVIGDPRSEERRVGKECGRRVVVDLLDEKGHVVGVV